MNLFTRNKILMLATALFFVAGFLLVTSGEKVEAQQPTTQNIVGYIWSSNVGWISMDCVQRNECGAGNYGVTLDTASGALSGFGYSGSGTSVSSTLGYIDFNSSGTSQVDMDTGNITGEARMCAVYASGCSGSTRPTAQTGGWDGIVSLTGLQINLETGQFSGSAWGGNVLGWIDFSYASTDPIVIPASGITFVASPNTVTAAGDQTQLEWTSVGDSYSSCEARSSAYMSADWNSTTIIGSLDPATPGSKMAVVNDPQTDFEIRCKDSTTGVFTPWIMASVQISNLCIGGVGNCEPGGGATCVDPVTGDATVTWWNTGSTTYSSCVATSNPSIPQWQGSLPVPTPYSSQTASVAVPASSLPVELGVQCSDTGGWWPSNMPASTTISGMCESDTQSTPTLKLSGLPFCLQDYPLTGNETVELTYFGTNTESFVSCEYSSSPPISEWSGSIPPSQMPLDPGNPFRSEDIPVSVFNTNSVGQMYAITCKTAEGDITSSDVRIGYICNEPPIADLTVSPNSLEGPDDVDISWDTEFAYGCDMTSIPSTSINGTSLPTNVHPFQVTATIVPDGNINNIAVTETTYFKLTCGNPGGTAEDTEVVCVGDQGLCPTDPCELYPNDPVCRTGFSVPIFEEL